MLLYILVYIYMNGRYTYWMYINRKKKENKYEST